MDGYCLALLNGASGGQGELSHLAYPWCSDGDCSSCPHWVVPDICPFDVCVLQDCALILCRECPYALTEV